MSTSVYPVAPPATASAVVHADWLELHALRVADRSSSFQDLVQNVRRSGSIDEVGAEAETDSGGNKSEMIATDAFSELEHRRRSCDGNPAYPFVIEGAGTLRCVGDPSRSLYVFLLLLDQYGEAAGPPGLDGAKLFERVGARAASGYLGGVPDCGREYVFGFPRHIDPRGFCTAVDDLCSSLGEGGGSNKANPTATDQKDGKLDIVIWQPFPDMQAGQLIAFGQCATGRNWRTKVSELSPQAFLKKWVRSPYPALDPVRIFLTSHRIEERLWFDVAVDGGLLFDRCRIAYLVSGLDGDVRQQLRAWTAHVLREKVRA